MSDDLQFVAGETAIAVDALIAARIACRDVDLAVERLEGWLRKLATVTPPSAMRDVALAGADHPRGPASNPFGGSAPISREAIRAVAVQRAKRVLACEHGITAHELDRRLDREQLALGIRRYLERLCWDDEDIRMLLSHGDIGLIDKEV